MESGIKYDQGFFIWGNRVIIAKALQQNVLKNLHEAHPGMSRMKSLARSYFWWVKMDEDIKKRVKMCESCQKHQSILASALVYPWERTNNPWVRLHIDYLGPFMGKMFLVIVDSCSK